MAPCTQSLVRRAACAPARVAAHLHFWEGGISSSARCALLPAARSCAGGRREAQLSHRLPRRRSGPRQGRLRVLLPDKPDDSD